MSSPIKTSTKKPGKTAGGNHPAATPKKTGGEAGSTGRNGGKLRPEAFSQLREAFQVFNNASNSFVEQYGLLEKRIAELNIELETANARLRRNLDEKQKMQNHLSTLLESLPVGVIAVDCEGFVCSLNGCAAKILDFSPSPPPRTALGSLFQGSEGKNAAEGEKNSLAFPALSKAVASGFTIEDTFEIEIQPVRGRRLRTLRLRVVPTGSARKEREAEDSRPPENAREPRPEAEAKPAAPDDEAAAVILVEDVTDMRRLEQQANRNNRLTAMGEIAINVAHEIRNPLGSIELFASMLQRDLSKDETNGPLAAHICTGVRCLDHIVSNILQFARPQRLSCSQVDLCELIDETLLFTEHVLRQKKIRIERHYPGSGSNNRGTGSGGCRKGTEAPPDAGLSGTGQPSLSDRQPEASEDPAAETPGIRMWADAELIKQMLLNLFLNAIQATPEEGVIGVQSIPNCATVELRVWDTGSGIPADALGKIFDPFFTTRRKGTGLGLTIVHNIVTAHQGSIDAENRPEGGALFTIVLPKRVPKKLEDAVVGSPLPEVKE